MRKQAGLAVDAKIKVEVVIDDERIQPLVESQQGIIENEVRATCMKIRLPTDNVCGCNGVSDDTLVKDWEIDDLKVKISVAPVE